MCEAGVGVVGRYGSSVGGRRQCCRGGNRDGQRSSLFSPRIPSSDPGSHMNLAKVWSGANILILIHYSGTRAWPFASRAPPWEAGRRVVSLCEEFHASKWLHEEGCVLVVEGTVALIALGVCRYRRCNFRLGGGGGGRPHAGFAACDLWMWMPDH